MKAEDLRIGNLVLVNGLPSRVTVRDLVKIAEGSEDYAPIPITEEWLIELGFSDYGGEGSVCKQKLFRDSGLVYSPGMSWLIVGESCTCGYMGSGDVFVEPPHHVHELQNLYRWLTGTELAPIEKLETENMTESEGLNTESANDRHPEGESKHLDPTCTWEYELDMLFYEHNIDFVNKVLDNYMRQKMEQSCIQHPHSKDVPVLDGDSDSKDSQEFVEHIPTISEGLSRIFNGMALSEIEQELEKFNDFIKRMSRHTGMALADTPDPQKIASK